MNTILHFQLSDLSFDEFDEDLGKVWARLQRSLGSDHDLRERLRSSGIPPDALDGHPASDFFRIEQGTAGLTGLETVLVNLFTGLALKLFETFVLPELKKGKKAEAIRPVERNEDQQV